MAHSSQSCTYAPLPGHQGGAGNGAAVEHWQTYYDEGDTDDDEMEYYVNTPQVNKDNNVMIIALSVTTGSLLIIIMMMLFAVKPRAPR